MSGKAKRRRLLAIIATDSTFLQTGAGRAALWRGKCIHCRRWLVIAATGEPVSQATIEHIVPRHHGGTDELDNLAIACASCNREKGKRHDVRGKRDDGLMSVVATLKAERARRWREPDAALAAARMTTTEEEPRGARGKEAG